MGHGDRRGAPGRGRLHRQWVLDVRARRRGAPGAPGAGSVRTASAVQPALAVIRVDGPACAYQARRLPTAVDSRTRAAACRWTLLRCVSGSTPRWSLYRSAGARWPCQHVALGVTLTLNLGLVPRWSRCWMRRPRSWARWSSRPCWPPSRSASASSTPCRCTRRCAWTARRARPRGAARVGDSACPDVTNVKKWGPAVGAKMLPLVCCVSELPCGTWPHGSAETTIGSATIGSALSRGPVCGRPDRAHPRHALLGQGLHPRPGGRAAGDLRGAARRPAAAVEGAGVRRLIRARAGMLLQQVLHHVHHTLELVQPVPDSPPSFGHVRGLIRCCQPLLDMRGSHGRAQVGSMRYLAHSAAEHDNARNNLATHNRHVKQERSPSHL